VLSRVHDNSTSLFKLETQRRPEPECLDARLDFPLERIDGDAEVGCAAPRTPELADARLMLPGGNDLVRRRAA